MRLYQEMFQVWVTKHIWHFQGTNRQLSHINKLVINACPSYGYHNERITRCWDPGQLCILKDLVEQFIWWLYDQQTDGKVIHLFKEYCKGNAHTNLTAQTRFATGCGSTVPQSTWLGLLSGGLTLRIIG
jgi:hypothetical protein